MKIVSLLLSLCLASVALAEDPAELERLRKTWENSQAEAKKKAEEIYRSKNTKASKLYYDELYELKDNFMGAKNLQGAIAVDAEIKKLVETHRKQKFEVPKQAVAPQKKQLRDKTPMVTVNAWENSKAPHATGIILRKGQKISLKPNTRHMWTGGGTKKGVYCDYMGYEDRGNSWMRLMSRIGKRGEKSVTAEELFTAENDGELFLYVNDGDVDTNRGAIGVVVEIDPAHTSHLKPQKKLSP
jgi:hypothetical protein